MFARKPTPTVTVERTGEYAFTLRNGVFALQCSYVVRTTAAAGTWWQVLVRKIDSDSLGIATSQRRFSGAVPADEAVQSVKEAVRLLGGGTVEVYLMDGLLRLGPGL